MLQIKIPSSGLIDSTSPRRVVRQLELALEQLGYDVGKADGTYNARTTKAIMAFQRKAKLEADGLVGPKTARAINKALRQQASQN